MRVRRIIGATVVAGIAAGMGLLAAGGVGVAATPAPTPVSLNATGLGSSTCGPLPLNAALAFKPGTTIEFSSALNLALGPVTMTIQSEAKTIPAPKAVSYSVSTANPPKIAFPNKGTYDVKWSAVNLLNIVTAQSSGKLVIDANATKCVVGVQVPVPSVSVPVVPSAINSTVNGILSSGASAVNGVLSPVNSAVGPILGGVNSTVGGVIAPITGGANPITGGGTGSGTGPGTIYKPTGPTVAQKTVPQNAGSGNGAPGSYVGTTGNSINAPALGFKGTGGNGSASSTAVKSGGSPKTVELAANKPRSALNGFSTVIVVIAIVALSGATAFYARTFLLHPPQAQA
jgi:hypothetical protein